MSDASPEYAGVDGAVAVLAGGQFGAPGHEPALGVATGLPPMPVPG